MLLISTRAKLHTSSIPEQYSGNHLELVVSLETNLDPDDQLIIEFRLIHNLEPKLAQVSSEACLVNLATQGGILDHVGHLHRAASAHVAQFPQLPLQQAHPGLHGLGGEVARDDHDAVLEHLEASILDVYVHTMELLRVVLSILQAMSQSVQVQLLVKVNSDCVHCVDRLWRLRLGNFSSLCW